jgi:hypothetical protein
LLFELRNNNGKTIEYFLFEKLKHNFCINLNNLNNNLKQDFSINELFLIDLLGNTKRINLFN